MDSEPSIGFFHRQMEVAKFERCGKMGIKTAYLDWLELWVCIVLITPDRHFRQNVSDCSPGPTLLHGPLGSMIRMTLETRVVRAATA